MDKMAVLLNFIVFTISLANPIDDSTTNVKIGEISEKLRNINGEDVLSAMNQEDILNTSEMNDDYTKHFFVNVRYLQESEATDKHPKVSPESNTATTSSSIKVRINSVDVNNPIHESEFRSAIDEKKDGENKSNKNTEDFRRKERPGDSIENKEGTGQSVESNEVKADSIKTNLSNNDSDNIEANVDNNHRKPNDESNSEWDNVQTRRMNADLDDSHSTSDKNVDYLNRNAASPEQKSIENLEKKDITRSGKNVEENNNKNHNDEIGTRSEEKKAIESLNEKERKAEMDDISRSAPVPEYINRVRNNDGKKHINLPYDGIVHSPAVPASTTHRKNSYGPIVSNIQHNNPIDLNNVLGSENILGYNPLMPFTRRSNIPLNDESASDPLNESKVLTIDDFNSEQFVNAYPYTPAITRPSMREREPLPSRRYDPVFLKLKQASEDSRKDYLSAERVNFNKAFHNSYRPGMVIPPKYGLYRIINVRK